MPCFEKGRIFGLPSQAEVVRSEPRDEILGHQFFNRRLEFFAPCYSQSLQLAKKENYTGYNNSYKKSPKQDNSNLFHE
jgi:hypothetical protein